MQLALLPGDPHVFLSCGEDAVVYEIDLREDQPHRLRQLLSLLFFLCTMFLIFVSGMVKY